MSRVWPFLSVVVVAGVALVPFPLIYRPKASDSSFNLSLLVAYRRLRCWSYYSISIEVFSPSPVLGRQLTLSSPIVLDAVAFVLRLRFVEIT